MTAKKKYKYEYILVDIDTQNDFMNPNGSLYMQDSDVRIPNVVRLIEWAGRSGIPVLSTQDSHVENDPEFEQFPPHCVIGTWGQQKIPGTLLEPHKVVNCQGEAVDVRTVFDTCRQLIFEKPTLDLFDNPSAEKVMAELSPEYFVVAGVATDYCVKIVVEDLLKLNKNVILVIDAIEGVDKAKSEAIITGLRSRGVRMITTDEIAG